jgi:nitronate monooxygenase
MMGTRFVAATESGAHDAYKAALVAAGPDDQAYTNCYDIGWPYAMHGVLRNSTFNAWEAAGCPAAPHRPGEDEIVFRCGTEELPHYSDTPPSVGSQGELLAACLYAGKGVGHIESVLPAADIVTSLWRDALKLL